MNDKKRARGGAAKYPTAPRVVRGGEVWFYEEPGGVCVVFLVGKSGAVIAPKKLPWSMVCRAVDNHRRVVRARRGVTSEAKP